MKSGVKRPASTIAPKGWFSRKHESADAHTEAVSKWLNRHGPAARRARAQERIGNGSLTY